ncbi:MAG: L,D-transpeptidase [Planctomycetes bacterium]|jgi:hypothetical protein|nr:L,D-transpeptidase [Planctomycetota bacterium]
MKKAALVLLAALIPLSLANQAYANGLSDRDRDGVPDDDEIGVYYTDPDKADTDGDGYNDRVELMTGYSPFAKERIKLEASDFDQDGLSDRLEYNFHTDPTNPDSDGDGFTDGAEIAGSYDPLNRERVKLAKRLEINLGVQELSYFLGGVRLGKYAVSSGRPGMGTPRGHFVIDGKHPRAWSSWGLWMPWWMSLKNGYFGIHELPEWPNGHKEGADHLGQPVSHGCVRLGVGPAKFLYDWAPTGTPVFIY